VHLQRRSPKAQIAQLDDLCGREKHTLCHIQNEALATVDLGIPESAQPGWKDAAPQAFESRAKPRHLVIGSSRDSFRPLQQRECGVTHFLHLSVRLASSGLPVDNFLMQFDRKGMTET
jgi:hypothetical protein